MQRVAIIGNGGSGKTWLARALGCALQLPVTHLDTLFYDDGWRSLATDEFAAVQRELVAMESWVIDGNYASTLPIRLAAADTVVQLDLPATACLSGIVARRLRTGGGQHPTTGVYDRVTVGFVRYVWGYRAHMRPRVDALVAEHARHAVVVRLTSRRSVRTWLATVRGRPAALRSTDRSG